MKIQDIKLGIIDYIDSEIAAKAQGIMKWGIYSFGVIFGLKGDQIIERSLPVLGYFDLTNGNDIDIDTLYKGAKEGIKKSGSFTWNGIIFDDKDIEKLFTFIRKKEVKENA